MNDSPLISSPTQSLPDPSLTLNKSELAEHLRVSQRQIDVLTASGGLPPPFLVGQSRRWSRQTIIDWIERNEKATSND